MNIQTIDFESQQNMYVENNSKESSDEMAKAIYQKFSLKYSIFENPKSGYSQTR